MVEVGCICCGAELSDRGSYLRPVMSSMCGSCTREVEFMQRAAEITKQQDRPAVTHRGRWKSLELT